MEKIGEFLASLPEELYIFLISILPVIELRGAIPVGAAIGLPIYVNYPVAILGNMLPVPFILLFIPKILDFLSRYKIFRPLVGWLRKKADRGSQRVLKENEDGAGVTENAKRSELNTQNDTEEAECTVINDEKINGPSVNSEVFLRKECEESDNAEKVYGNTENPHETSLSADTSDTVEKEQTVLDGCTKNTKSSRERRDMSAAIFTALMLFVAIPLPGTGAWTGSLVAALFNLPRRRSLISIFLGVLISGAIMSLASYGVVGFLSFLI